MCSSDLNSVERAMILCDGTSIGPELLGVEADAEPRSDPAVNRGDVLQAPAQGDDTNLSIEDFLQKVILENQDHKTETELAQMLGISRKSLWEKRQKLNIPRERTRKA